ncbi:hypothetical protein [Demequina sp. NBRC 110051]|uniref:hypothetical protein n=1 Tax=Demequina sp. NBRC 110051 TaxID=1570340 RepID=UPI000A03B894|nr:hypothetical protein [Demequina sp. NBRC 110051]
MTRVEDAVTALYRDPALAGLAFALAGSVEGGTALMRAAAPRAVARGWRLSRGLKSRMRDALAVVACERWRSGEANEPSAPSEGDAAPSAFAPPAAPESASVQPAPPALAPEAAGGHNPYAPPSSSVAPVSPTVDAATVPVAAQPHFPPPSPEPADERTAEAPQAETQPPEPLSDLDLAIAALPDDIRLAMALHYRCDRDARAIARAMRLGRDEVIELLALGRSRLAATLGTSEQDVERLVVTGVG